MRLNPVASDFRVSPNVKTNTLLKRNNPTTALAANGSVQHAHELLIFNEDITIALIFDASMSWHALKLLGDKHQASS